MMNNPMNKFLIPDDTQPRLPATQPLAPIRKQSRWVWLVLMFSSAITLFATLGWALNLREVRVPQVAPALVVVVDDGKRTDYQTVASTIGEFLAQAGITIGTDDKLSENPTTSIREATILTIVRARDVLLMLDGKSQTLRTAYQMPFDILKEASITLNENDLVWLDGVQTKASEVLLWTIPSQQIEIRRAVEVVVIDNGQETSFISTSPTVGEALLEANITLYLTDIVRPAIGEPLTTATRIIITRAQPIFIELDGKRIETRVQGGTVSDALSEAGVALIGLDKVFPDESSLVTSGMTIDVIRVTEETLWEDAPLPYESTYQADPNLPLDTRQVSQAGQNGILRQYVRVRYEDGQEVTREPANQEIIQAPVAQVVSYGTQIVLYTADTPDGTITYWRKLRVFATSYHPAELGGDNITAIGEVVRRGIIGADPKIIPYRTSVYVAGYGTGIIADTGGPRSSPYWIDLGYEDEEYVPWARYVDLYLIAPAPANVNYLLPEWTPLRNTSGW